MNVIIRAVSNGFIVSERSEPGFIPLREYVAKNASELVALIKVLASPVVIFIPEGKELVSDK